MPVVVVQGEGVTLEKLYPLGQTLRGKISLTNILNFVYNYTNK